MCGIFKGGVREPDWQTVSNKLKLNLRGQVSVVEFYQAWCKLGPSWENLSLALGKLQGYQPVMEQVKKKAGTYGCCTLLPSVAQNQCIMLESVYEFACWLICSGILIYACSHCIVGNFQMEKIFAIFTTKH